MDTQDPPSDPAISFTRGLIGLDNEKDAMTSCCLDRKEVRRHLASAQYWTGLAGGNTGLLFLTFGGPVCADRIIYCPLDRVLTYKNLIYLLNLQFCSLVLLGHLFTVFNSFQHHHVISTNSHQILLPNASQINENNKYVK